MRRARVPVVLAAVAVSAIALDRDASAAGAARAEPSGASAAPAEVRPLRFSADRLELDPQLERLELRGNVVITVDRYRLTSDHLTMDKTPRGVAVDGAGRVAACPCPEPPVTFGFQSALVAPPTDLLLTQPTLRLFGVPVLWLPYLWFRSPRRPGLLPLIVAYRGEDGFVAGSGVHVPVSDGALDLSAAGYFKGGVDVGAGLVTGDTATRVRWDYVRGSLLAVDLRGALSGDDGGEGPGGGGKGVVAWSADALRGGRALTGPVSLEEASLRQDRARISAGSSNGIVTGGVYATSAAPRGDPIRSLGIVGPGAHAGVGGALGAAGAFDAGADVATLRIPGGTSTLVAEHAEIRLDGRAGPVGISGSVRSRGLATLDEDATGYAAAGGVALDATMPLVREYGAPESPVEHWVTPFASFVGGAADTRAPSVAPNVAPDGLFYAASSGVRSTLGEVAGDRGAVAVGVRGAVLNEATLGPRAALALDASGRARRLAVALRGVVLNDGRLALGNVRIGPERGPFLRGRVFGTDGDVPIVARLLEGGWDAPWVPWLALPGWSAGGGVGVPWTRWLYMAADGDYDVTERTLLGVRGSLGYRHPCGCLAVTLWGGHRVGREGVDAFLAADLTP